MRDTGMKWYRLGDLTNFENVEHGYGADTKKNLHMHTNKCAWHRYETDKRNPTIRMWIQLNTSSIKLYVCLC